jgi:hypothetical protein
MRLVTLAEISVGRVVPGRPVVAGCERAIAIPRKAWSLRRRWALARSRKPPSWACSCFSYSARWRVSRFWPQMSGCWATIEPVASILRLSQSISSVSCSRPGSRQVAGGSRWAARTGAVSARRNPPRSPAVALFGAGSSREAAASAARRDRLSGECRMDGALVEFADDCEEGCSGVSSPVAKNPPERGPSCGGLPANRHRRRKLPNRELRRGFVSPAFPA